MLAGFHRENEPFEKREGAAVAVGDMLHVGSMNGEIGSEELVGVVLGLSASAVIAICGAIVAWLKFRHPPNNK